MPNHEDFIQAENLTFRYGSAAHSNPGERNILDGISLKVVPSQWLAIMGPSGSGKTTLLKCLSGLIKPISGGVRFLGRPISHLSSNRLAKLRATEMGFIFEKSNNIAALKTWQNVTFADLAAGKTKKLDREKAIATLERVGLADKADSYPDDLDFEQQQRLAIARVLHQDPHIVFADEPAGTLDRESARIVMDQLSLLRENDGMIIMVTHDPWIASFADDVVFLRDGSLTGSMHRARPSEIALALSRLEGSAN